MWFKPFFFTLESVTKILYTYIYVDALSETRSPCCEYTEPLLKSVGWTLYETIVSVFCGYFSHVNLSHIRIMEIDGKFRNKPFCCIKGPKCGSRHFFLHLSLLQKYYTHIYTCTLKIILIGQIKLNDRLVTSFLSNISTASNRNNFYFNLKCHFHKE
jgi:hypothetical protein